MANNNIGFQEYSQVSWYKSSIIAKLFVYLFVYLFVVPPICMLANYGLFSN